jgi:predicted nucleotidyltransferase
MSKIQLKEKHNKLKEIFKKNRVIFAYLFGSQAKRKVGKLSDIDIAVFLDEKISPQKYFNIKLKLIGEFMDFFKTNDIDVVVLNEAPPLLAHRILKEGKIIFCLNKKKQIEYEVRAIMKYLDWKPYLEKYTQEVFG